MIGYIYIFGCIAFTVFGQLILKWRMNTKGEMPEAIAEKVSFLFTMFLDPWVISAFASAFVASIFWMSAMTKFDISFAYPFMSLSFVLVFFLSIYIFGEQFTWGKLLGLIVVIIGLLISVKL